MSQSKLGKSASQRAAADPLVSKILDAIEAGTPLRQDLADGGRLHIDRPLPFLCVHLTNDRDQLAARQVVSANASYLITSDLTLAVRVAEAIGSAMTKRFGAFLLMDVGELERDRLLAEDAPYLPSYEISLSAATQSPAVNAIAAFVAATESVEVRFRSPRITRRQSADDVHAELSRLASPIPCVTVRFAPIYRVPESTDVYPELLDRLVANIFDAALQAIAAFLRASDAWHHPTHRSLGRKVFVEVVTRADRVIDQIAAAFDLLLAVTPINADAAWQEFRSTGFDRAPRLLYRPLTVQIDDEKQRLFSLAFERFEDPVLIDLYREKQQELDLQLSMLSARDTSRFLAIGRALYGSVEPTLVEAAKELLSATGAAGAVASKQVPDERVDCYFLEQAAQSMIATYRAQHPDFTAEVEIRDDLLPGMMVLKNRLLISRRTTATRDRVNALLSHEIGVHILTYYNGSQQGLRIFRSGLSGYENAQEGLAVIAEFLVGGITVARLRLLAARVLGCAMMLDGASFGETFQFLVREHEFSRAAAFNLVLRLYRGGGFPKDAVYLRGVLEILDHLRRGGSLDLFWTGKISASSFGTIEELRVRELIKPPAVQPAFLSRPEALLRLEIARSGISAADMIAN